MPQKIDFRLSHYFKYTDNMRVISMVPSWTETLLEAGVDVVGRTRFCIHPRSIIPIVGGTKDWDWPKVKQLKPDLLILDQEENPKLMAEQTEIPFLATHITSLKDVPRDLDKLATALKNPGLTKLKAEWQQVADRPSLQPWQPPAEIPGLLQWGRKPTQPITDIQYVIWKNPWMVVSSDTFIGSVLEFCGLPVTKQHERYPKIDLSSLPDKETTLLLFSSEPYPFLKKPQGLSELGHPYAIVNGECFSWFGVRSLRFLQGLK